ncbi:MAG TPA: Uma2 family endonuclease [Actinomycetota bacterium]|nr:Uma2 family endonuclease [Actinomycetota bacterium]
MRIGVRLSLHGERQGGLVLASPMDVLLTEGDVVQPDVLYLLPEHAKGVERPLTRLDLAVEVSSPSTHRTDTVLKRDLYQRHGVPEYWFVDLATDRIHVHRLEGGRYPDPEVLGPQDVLTTPLLPGFSARVDDLLAL